MKPRIKQDSNIELASLKLACLDYVNLLDIFDSTNLEHDQLESKLYNKIAAKALETLFDKDDINRFIIKKLP